MERTALIDFWNKVIRRFSITNSLMICFLSVAVTYLIHFWSKGNILSSPLLTYVIFFTSFVIFSVNIWPWMKFNTDYTWDPSDWRWIIISLFAGCLTISAHFMMSISPGDFRFHKVWILQLLNGSLESSNFYMNDPGLYPFISHAIVAVFTNLSGLYAQHSLIFVLVLISFLIPLISYKLARQIGFSPWLSLFFSSLISLYGGMENVGYLGHTGVNYYLPTIQIIKPFLGRNVGLLLFLLFLISCSKFNRFSKLEINNSLNAGILLGVLGLTHSNGFFPAILLIFIIFGISYKAKCLQKEVLLNLAIILVAGAVLASLHYIPLIFKISNYGGSVIAPQGESFPTRYFFSFYGLLPFLGLCSLLNKRNETRDWILLSFLLIISIFFIRFILGLVISLDTWMAFRINYFGPFLFIFLAVIVIAGIDNLFRFKKIRHVVTVIMILMILNGYKIAYDNLRDDYRSEPGDLIPGIEKSEIIGTLFGNYFQETADHSSDMTRSEVVRTIIVNLFPEKGIEKLRYKIVNTTNTLIVPTDPPELAFVIAHETGLNVSYIPDFYFSPLVRFKKVTISQEERLKAVDLFYHDLKKGILRKDILSFFNTDIFLSPSGNLMKIFSQLEQITTVLIENKEYFLYKLQ